MCVQQMGRCPQEAGQVPCLWLQNRAGLGANEMCLHDGGTPQGSHYSANPRGMEESKFASFGKPLLLHTQESQVP